MHGASQVVYQEWPLGVPLAFAQEYLSGRDDSSVLGGSPGLGVRDCSGLGNSLGEQVRFGLAHEHWPAKDFGQLGQCSVQLLQYSTGTEVVR